MADLFKKITDSRNLIEKIGAAIPGFKGYADRNSRRDADKLLRETVAGRFEQQWSRISGIQRDVINQGSIELVDDLEAAVVKIRTLVDRVRTASYGYAGFFDAVKINEPELAQLYQFDASLLDRAVQMAAAVDNVASSVGSDGMPAAVRNVAALAQDALDAFQGRNELILGSGTPTSQ
jgi:hypothetical protein